jgi:hypothetical protein
VEEIGGQERAGVGAQEHAPGSVVPRWRRDAVGASRWCQRSSVPGVTIRRACSAFGVILVKAA